MVGTGGSRMGRLGIVLAFAFLMIATAAWAGKAEVRSSAARKGPRPQARGRGAGASRSGGVLLGDSSVERRVGRGAAGTLEVFRFVGKRTGTATSISVFVASHSTARVLKAGLYGGKGRRPGSLLSSGSVSFLRARRWNTIEIGSTAVFAGRSYWVAVLAEHGRVVFRDRRDGGCVGARSSVVRLGALPSRVRKVRRLRACPISAFASGTFGTVSGGQPGPPAKAPGGPGGHAVDGKPASLTAPSIVGVSRQGDALSASTGSWSNSPTSYAYQWRDCDASGGSCQNISGASSSTYMVQSSDVGDTIDVVVTASNAGGSGSASSAPSAVVTTTVSIVQPVGDPLGRSWTEVFDDEFNGTSIDASRWVAVNGWGNNNVTSNAKNCTESGGSLVLALPGDGTGCDLYSSEKDGAGPNAVTLNVGDYVEARIFFPGPGTTPTSTIDNWPAFWAYDGSGNWNAGENDIAEALGHMEYNYHSTSTNSSGRAPSLSPAGEWGNSWHVYGIYRAATQVEVFYDGVLIGTVATSDNGGPESIMFTSGKTDACCGAPAVYGPAGNVLVDWVREWN